MEQQYRLEMVDISKRFGGVAALNNVSLQVLPGQVHALVGENGAGKSTLLKILSGAYTRDTGKIFIDGREAKINKPSDSIGLGVAVIYQEFMLAPDLTVAENIYIDKLSQQKGGIINWKKLRADTKAQLDKLGFGDIDPNAKVGSLSVAYQQVVEICKCLTRNAKILVFDEPTALLTFQEIEKLFQIINQLKEQGVSIIYVSHRLEEIFQLCQNVTILKDGQVVGTWPIEELDNKTLVNRMVGRELKDMFPPRDVTIGEEVLRVEDLHAGKMCNGVSFSVHAGEVLAFSGLVGAGRTETMRAIFGADKRDSGKVYYMGKEVHWKTPKAAIKDSFGLLPEDRKKQGLLLHQPIQINTTLACLHKVENDIGVLKLRKEKSYVKELLAEVTTKYGKIEDDASSLSGGNQQKVALAKWVAADCKCIVFDEPTRGVDVGAKTEIYKIMNELAAKGVAIIMISSEMPEVIGMADRAVVMRNGKVMGTFDKSELSEHLLIKYAMGV